MKILLSHPTGNANVRAALKGFKEANLLVAFYTTIASFSGSFLDKLSAISFLKEIKRRQFDSNLREITKTHSFKEFGRLIAIRLNILGLTKQESSLFSIDSVYRNLDDIVSKKLKSIKEINAVYAYEDGALQTFKAAKKLHITCLYDLPIGYWRSARKLLEEERIKRPDWACTLTGFEDSIQKLENKDEELALADQIIVASSFTKLTLKDYPRDNLVPITVIPYGFPPIVPNRIYNNLENRPLKLLFVGSLSQRKGIANLLEAVAVLGNEVSLTIVGHKVVENCHPLNEALKQHHYIPSLPHSEILKLMREQDVFVFPSLFEGFGLVITEAMSQGTPVITTNRTVGPDLIVDEENGWLVEAGSTTSLLSCIKKIINNPSLIKKAGLAAIATAKQRPWECYSNELSSYISQNA